MSCSLVLKLFVSVTYAFCIGSAKADTKISSNGSRNNDFVTRNHSAILDFLTRGRIKDNAYGDVKSKTDLSWHFPTYLPQLSLCPWTERWDEDKERVPQFIPKAKCQQSYCNFEFANLDWLTSLKLNMDTCCEPFTTDMYSMKHGEVNLERDWPVACICKKRNEPLSDLSISNTLGTQQKIMSYDQTDVIFQKYDSQNQGYNTFEIPHIGAENLFLDAAQRERFLRQETLKMQHSESFEDEMKRQKKR